MRKKKDDVKKESKKKCKKISIIAKKNKWENDRGTLNKLISRKIFISIFFPSIYMAPSNFLMLITCVFCIFTLFVFTCNSEEMGHMSGKNLFHTIPEYTTSWLND